MARMFPSSSVAVLTWSGQRHVTGAVVDQAGAVSTAHDRAAEVGGCDERRALARVEVDGEESPAGHDGAGLPADQHCHGVVHVVDQLRGSRWAILDATGGTSRRAGQ